MFDVQAISRFTMQSQQEKPYPLSDLDIRKPKLLLEPVRPYSDNLVGTEAILA